MLTYSNVLPKLDLIIVIIINMYFMIIYDHTWEFSELIFYKVVLLFIIHVY